MAWTKIGSTSTPRAIDTLVKRWAGLKQVRAARSWTEVWGYFILRRNTNLSPQPSFQQLGTQSGLDWVTMDKERRGIGNGKMVRSWPLAGGFQVLMNQTIPMKTVRVFILGSSMASGGITTGTTLLAQRPFLLFVKGVQGWKPTRNGPCSPQDSSTREIREMK